MSAKAVPHHTVRMVVDAITAPSERDVLEWTLTTALSNLHQAGFLDREGDKRTTRYRLSEAFLKRIYEREIELDEQGQIGGSDGQS